MPRQSKSRSIMLFRFLSLLICTLCLLSPVDIIRSHDFRTIEKHGLSDCATLTLTLSPRERGQNGGYSLTDLLPKNADHSMSAAPMQMALSATLNAG